MSIIGALEKLDEHISSETAPSSDELLATKAAHLDQATAIEMYSARLYSNANKQIDKKELMDREKATKGFSVEFKNGTSVYKFDKEFWDDRDKITGNVADEDKTVSNDGSKETKETTTTPETTNENNNVSKEGDQPSEPKTTSPKSMRPCGWCHDLQADLNYILPTISGDSLEFCSEMCIVEFRKVVKKGACKQCGNAIRSTIAPNRDYCSTFCWHKARPESGKISYEPERLLFETNFDIIYTILGRDDVITTTTTNSNGNEKKLYKCAPLPRSVQVESMQDFNWDDYLIVSEIMSFSFRFLL